MKEKPPTTPEQEQVDTLDRITASTFLTSLKYGPRILRYLFRMRENSVTEAQIAVDVLEAKTEKQVSGGNARQHIKSLREALELYVEARLFDDDWRFALPEQVGSEGYRLRITNLRPVAGAAMAFWRAHLKPVRPIVVVCNEPIFYRDEDARAVVRFPDGDLSQGEEGKTRIHRALSSALDDGLEGEIYESHLYALSGEIGARDRLAEWFSKEAGQRVRAKVSRHMLNADEIAECSTILLGNVRSNKILKEVTEGHQYQKFQFHVDAERCRTVRISSPEDNERKWLMAKYPDQAEESGDDDILLTDNPRRGRVVFATVTRLPNHYTSDGAITVLSSSYTKVLEQLGLLLTDEQDLQDLFKKVKWDLGRDVPRYFQWLFSIRLGKRHADNRPDKPKLRLERSFNSFNEHLRAKATVLDFRPLTSASTPHIKITDES